MDCPLIFYLKEKAFSYACVFSLVVVLAGIWDIGVTSALSVMDMLSTDPVQFAMEHVIRCGQEIWTWQVA